MSATLGTKPPQDRVREEVVVDVMEAFDEEEQAFRTSRATVADTLKEDEFDGAAAIRGVPDGRHICSEVLDGVWARSGGELALF